MFDQDSVPMPIVLIDQDSDSNATIVEVSFGDRLGALIDTVTFQFYYLVLSRNCITSFHISYSLYTLCEVNLRLCCTMSLLKYSR